VLEQLHAPARDLAAPQLMLSQALLGQGDAAGAEGQARRALARAAVDSPLATHAGLQLAAALVTSGQFAAAADELNRVDMHLSAGGRSSLPERARAMALRAAVLDATGQSERAETQWTHAIETAEAAGGPNTRLSIDLRLDLVRMLILHHRDDNARVMLAPALMAMRGTGGSGPLEAALVEAEMGALMLYAGAGSVDTAAALAMIERGQEALRAPDQHPSALQRAWADAYAAEAALARGRGKTAQELARSAGEILLPSTHGPRARMQLLAVQARAAVRGGAPAQADAPLRDWLALADTRFPREAWRARLAQVEQRLAQDGWGEADKLLASITDSALASGGIDSRELESLEAQPGLGPAYRRALQQLAEALRTPAAMKVPG
jgi:hypothetical protein